MKHVSPETVETIANMKRDRRQVAEIMAATGLTFNQVVWLCRKNGLMKPRRIPGRIDLVLGVRVETALRREAARRGEKFTVFLREVLRRAVQDNLIPAILDDGK